MTFGLFEILGNGSKVRTGNGVEFGSIDAGLAHFGGKFVDHEISADGRACDLFVAVGAMGSVYAIEAI